MLARGLANSLSRHRTPGSSSPPTCCRRTSPASRSTTSTSGRFEFHPGPVFHQLVLADEINRASPKTQAALLEVMEEGQVTVDGVTHGVPRPFMVIATQNPIEQAGTYRLPEAQLDRFLMKTSVGYPDADVDRGAADERRRPRPRGDAVSRWSTARSCSEMSQIADRGLRRPRADQLRAPARRGLPRARARPARPVGPRVPGADPGREDVGGRATAAPTSCRRTWSPSPRRCSATACCSTPRRPSAASPSTTSSQQLLAAVPAPPDRA